MVPPSFDEAPLSRDRALPTRCSSANFRLTYQSYHKKISGQSFVGVVNIGMKKFVSSFILCASGTSRSKHKISNATTSQNFLANTNIIKGHLSCPRPLNHLTSDTVRKLFGNFASKIILKTITITTRTDSRTNPNLNFFRRNFHRSKNRFNNRWRIIFSDYTLQAQMHQGQLFCVFVIKNT